MNTYSSNELQFCKKLATRNNESVSIETFLCAVGGRINYFSVSLCQFGKI